MEFITGDFTTQIYRNKNICFKVTKCDDDIHSEENEGWNEYNQTKRDFLIAQDLCKKYPEHITNVFDMIELNYYDMKKIIQNDYFDELIECLDKNDIHKTKFIGFGSKYINGQSLDDWIKSVSYENFIITIKKIINFLFKSHNDFTHYDLHSGNIVLT